MQIKSGQKLYKVVLVFANEMTRTVTVKAATREVAEQRALKRNPTAVRVKREN